MSHAPVPLRRKRPDDLAGLLLPHLRAVTQEMADEICGQVPEYARSAGSPYARRMRQNITRTVERFMQAAAADGPVRLDDLIEMYAGLGAREARQGGSLERLETAIRAGGRVACRRLIKDAYRLDWSRDTLAALTDMLFGFLDEISAAAARGFADESRSDRERDRARLRDLIVADPPASEAAIVALARSAGWEPPRTIGVAAVLREQSAPPILPPTVLAHWADPVSYVIFPDPDGPGQHRLAAALARIGVAALGPTTPLTGGAVSLRWASQTLELVRAGVLDPAGLLRSVDHVVTLVAASGAGLIEAAIERRLAPLLGLSPARRHQLCLTLLTWLECGENTALTADRLAVHQQTVRYRLHRLEELFDGAPIEPEHRLELMLALHAYLRIQKS
ncbi:PucR family transcriptional regulator [Actinoallomurus acanthiterrae]